MKRLVRHRPSPAMVVACLALGIALTGTSVAAVTALFVMMGVMRCVQSSRSAASSLQPVPAEIAFSPALQFTVTVSVS